MNGSCRRGFNEQSYSPEPAQPEEIKPRRRQLRKTQGMVPEVERVIEEGAVEGEADIHGVPWKEARDLQPDVVRECN